MLKTESTDIKDPIVKLGSLLFEIEASTHIMHLQTRSFAKHAALNDVYQGIGGLRDRLLESYQGKESIIYGYNIKIDDSNLVDPIDYLNYCTVSIESYRAKLTTGYIQQIIDEILELLYSTLYKLKNLN